MRSSRQTLARQWPSALSVRGESLQAARGFVEGVPYRVDRTVSLPIGQLLVPIVAIIIHVAEASPP